MYMQVFGRCQGGRRTKRNPASEETETVRAAVASPPRASQFRQSGPVARNLSQPACPAHRGDPSPWFSWARTLSCHSHGSVRLAVLPRCSLCLPSALWATPADTLFPSFIPPPLLRLPWQRYPTSSRLPPAPAG